ncbi:MAG: sigma 54-interacting transcriptional regulator [Acidobacteria bacterium]|nr:sigma 54-interacting transcriptional regulator [Acidobacteriota bacterium]
MDDKKTFILIIDDDKKFIAKAKETLSFLGDVILDEGYTEADFYSLFRPGKYNAVILDLRLESGYEGMNLLEYALNEDPEAPIIVLTGYASIETAIKSLKLGAKDYLEKEHYQDKPFLAMIERIIIEDKARKIADRMISASASESQIIGNDIKIKKLLKVADWLAAEKESPILIVGEEGTEKEEIAQYLYKKSGARGKFLKRIIRTNEENIQEELFGDDKSQGLIKQAQGGVLYLEEVFRLSYDLQEQLLDFITTGVLKKDKKKQGLKVKLQLILSTSGVPVQKENDKTIHLPFYYRIKTPELFIPPLKERGDDIILLAQYYLSRLKNNGKTTAEGISDEVDQIFKEYPWPGNLLELRQVMESSALRAKLEEGRKIKVQHLPFELQKGFHDPGDSEPLNLDKILARTTLQYLKIALEKSGGAKLEAYRYLGYPEAKRGTLNSRIVKMFQTFPDLAGKFPDIYKLYLEE